MGAGNDKRSQGRAKFVAVPKAQAAVTYDTLKVRAIGRAVE